MVHQSGIDYRDRQLTQISKLYIAACEAQLTVGYPRCESGNLEESWDYTRAPRSACTVQDTPRVSTSKK